MPLVCSGAQWASTVAGVARRTRNDGPSCGPTRCSDTSPGAVHPRGSARVASTAAAKAAGVDRDALLDLHDVGAQRPRAHGRRPARGRHEPIGGHEGARIDRRSWWSWWPSSTWGSWWSRRSRRSSWSPASGSEPARRATERQRRRRPARGRAGGPRLATGVVLGLHRGGAAGLDVQLRPSSSARNQGCSSSVARRSLTESRKKSGFAAFRRLNMAGTYARAFGRSGPAPLSSALRASRPLGPGSRGSELTSGQARDPREPPGTTHPRSAGTAHRIARAERSREAAKRETRREIEPSWQRKRSLARRSG